MNNRNDILLTAGDLLKMREDDKLLEEEIRKLQQRRSENKRRLDAAEILADRHSDAADPGPFERGESEGEPEERGDQGRGVADNKERRVD